MIGALKLLRLPSQPKKLPIYDPQRPGTTVLVDLVVVKLLAEPLEDPKWATPRWRHDISKRVRLGCNEDELVKLIQLKAERARAKGDEKKLASIDYREHRLGYCPVGGRRPDHITLRLDDLSIALSHEESTRLREVIRDLRKRSVAWHEAQKEAQNQSTAVDAVADLLGIEALSA